MEEEETPKRAVVLTPPMTLEGGWSEEHRPPNLMQRIFSLFKNVRPGSNLSHFQLPPLFNMPKSQLQCYGETVYCIGVDMLGRCSKGRSSLDRFVSVVAWSVSTNRPPIFGLAPYNPVLGETHHVTNGSLNVLLEQIIISLPESEMASLSLVRVPLEPRNFHVKPHNPTSNGRRFLHKLPQKMNHRLSVSASVSATPPPVAVVDSAGGPSDLVRSILSKVEGTDRGVRLAEEGHREVDELASRLKRFCVDEPVKCPLIFGEWDVVYCSVPTSPGGGYRSAFGRLVFKTNEMVQVVEAPDTISNRVSFSAFGFLDGEVSLKGKLKVLDDKWIQVVFEPPHLKIGSLDFQYGGESEVKLEITYIDEKIRLGKGSRGSLFVFRRRG